VKNYMMKKRKSRILDTGKHLPKPGMGDWFELQQNRKTLVEKPILSQSSRDGTVLIGRHALNRLLGRGFHRSTYDFDVKSRTPLYHGQQIEKSIDQGTNSNLAYVESTSYPVGNRMEPLYRVRLHNMDTVEADFGLLKKDMKFVVKGGVRLETLDGAEKKYSGMIGRGEVHRMPNAIFDRGDIRLHRLIKKSRWR